MNVWETWKGHLIVKTKNCPGCGTVFRRAHSLNCPEFGRLTIRAGGVCGYCGQGTVHSIGCYGMRELGSALTSAVCADPNCGVSWVNHILDTFSFPSEWNCGDIPEDQDEDLPTFVTIEQSTIRCECGADSIRAPVHSSYCPKAGP